MMELHDRFMEWLLAAFDRFMDGITRNWWTQVRGEEVPQIRIVK